MIPIPHTELNEINAVVVQLLASVKKNFAELGV